MQLDINFVRQQFPALAQSSESKIAFLENAGGSCLCTQTTEILNSYYNHHRVQPYHATPISQDAGNAMNAGYTALATYLNVDENDLYFGPSTSQNTYVLANALWGYLQEGDEIIVTNQDHEANSGSWRRLKNRGVVVREWQVDSETGSLSLEKLHNLLSEKTKLVAFPHCSNILGEINPVVKICRMAHQVGAKAIVDGVSFAGHGLPDVKDLGADIYLFSLYKVYGPHLGVMVISQQMAGLLESQGHYFNSAEREKRLMPAGPDHAQIAAIKGVSNYFDAVFEHHYGVDGAVNDKAAIIRSLFHVAERVPLDRLLAYLNQHPKVTIVGPKTSHNRAPTISFLPQGQSPHALVRSVGDLGAMGAAGHFYSPRLLTALGINPDSGVARYSLVHYNSLADVDLLIDALEQCL